MNGLSLKTIYTKKFTLPLKLFLRIHDLNDTFACIFNVLFHIISGKFRIPINDCFHDLVSIRERLICDLIICITHNFSIFRTISNVHVKFIV
jgi:hypothetical protein